MPSNGIVLSCLSNDNPSNKQFDSKSSDSINGCFKFYGGYAAVSVFLISCFCVFCLNINSYASGVFFFRAVFMGQ